MRSHPLFLLLLLWVLPSPVMGQIRVFTGTATWATEGPLQLLRRFSDPSKDTAYARMLTAFLSPPARYEIFPNKIEALRHPADSFGLHNRVVCDLKNGLFYQVFDRAQLAYRQVLQTTRRLPETPALLRERGYAVRDTHLVIAGFRCTGYQYLLQSNDATHKLVWVADSLYLPFSPQVPAPSQDGNHPELVLDFLGTGRLILGEDYLPQGHTPRMPGRRMQLAWDSRTHKAIALTSQGYTLKQYDDKAVRQAREDARAWLKEQLLTRLAPFDKPMGRGDR